MAVETSPDGPEQTRGASAHIVVEAGDATALTIPGGALLLTADYSRSGPDLLPIRHCIVHVCNRSDRI